MFCNKTNKIKNNGLPYIFVLSYLIYLKFFFGKNDITPNVYEFLFVLIYSYEILTLEAIFELNFLFTLICKISITNGNFRGLPTSTILNHNDGMWTQ